MSTENLTLGFAFNTSCTSDGASSIGPSQSSYIFLLESERFSYPSATENLGGSLSVGRVGFVTFATFGLNLLISSSSCSIVLLF